MPKQLPKTIYVRVREDGDHSYFDASDEAELLVDQHEKITVGEYQLVQKLQAESVVTLKSK